MKGFNDRKLIAKIIEGDEKAFEVFYRYFFPKVYKYAYRRLKNREQAEDITSETFLKALKGLKSFEMQENGGLDVWMYAIERNVIRDFFRKSVGVEILPFEEVWSKVLNPPVDDPYIMLEKKEIDETVKLCIEHLPEEYREVIKLRFFEGKNLSEIAFLMNKTVGAVKVMQFRALKKLKELVEDKINEQRK